RTFAITTLISPATLNLSKQEWRKLTKNFPTRRSRCNVSLRKGIWSQFTLEYNTRLTRLKLPWCIFSVLKVTALLSCGISDKKHQKTHQTRMGCSEVSRMRNSLGSTMLVRRP